MTEREIREWYAKNNPIAPKPVYGPDGELLWHPDIPDMEDWKARQWVKRYVRRRRMWGRICGWWFAVVLGGYCLMHPETAVTPEEKADLDRRVRNVMLIASGPMMVRGFWHRVQAGP